MKDFFIKIFIFILSFYSINSICIQGENCPINQGFCKIDKCICVKNFWTLTNQDQTIPIIYCNYQRYNRYYLLIFEFFIPTSGHFISGKYYWAFFKLIFIIIPILSCIIGFAFYYLTRENDQHADYNEQNDNLHVANREQKNVELSTYLPVVITFISLSFLAVIHIIDIICYLFAFYSDGNGVPLY